MEWSFYDALGMYPAMFLAIQTGAVKTEPFSVSGKFRCVQFQQVIVSFV